MAHSFLKALDGANVRGFVLWSSRSWNAAGFPPCTDLALGRNGSLTDFSPWACPLAHYSGPTVTHTGISQQQGINQGNSFSVPDYAQGMPDVFAGDWSCCDRGQPIHNFELHRLFPPLPQLPAVVDPVQSPGHDAQIALLRTLVEEMRETITDLRADRDHWRECHQGTLRLLPKPVPEDAQAPHWIKRAWKWSRGR